MEVILNRMCIKRKDFGLFFIFCVYLEPALFGEIGILDNCFLILKIVVSLYVLWDIFVNNKKNFNIAQILSFVFFLAMIITTLINNGSFMQAFRTVFIEALSTLYLIHCLTQDGKWTIKILANVSLLLMTINYILFVFFPDGFGIYISGYATGPDSRLNFLGKDNNLIFFSLFALVMILLADIKQYKKIYAVIIVAVTMTSVWSGTGMIGCTLVVLYILLVKDKRIDKFFKWQTLSVLNIAAFISIVLLRVQDRFAFIIVDILGKDLTFTGRTSLWDLALYYISKKPVFGYGITDKFLVMQSGTAYSPHNLFLQILLTGGVFTFSLFVIYYLVSVSKLNHKIYGSSNLIAVVLSIYLIVSLTESTLNMQYLYWLLALAFCIDKYDNVYLERYEN